MKDILKTVRFDFITGAKLLPFCLTAAVICTLVAVLITPAAAALLIPFAVCVFLPVQNIAARCGFNKLYGILPIPRSSITRAAFLEYIASALFAEIIAVLLQTVSKGIGVYHSVRTSLLDPSGFTAAQQTLEQSAVFVVMMFAGISIFVCYMRMMSDLFGLENEAKILILSVFAALLIVVPLFVLRLKNVLPPASSWMPDTAAGKAAAACAAHLVTFGLCALMCEVTVKKLATREL